MDSTTSRIKQKTSPRETANCVSVATFWWMTSFLWNGSKKNLEKEDLYKVLSQDESETLGNQLEEQWDKELAKRSKALKNGDNYKPSLLKAMIRAFGPKFAFLGFWVLWEECLLRIFQPLFMSWFVRYFSSEDHGMSKYEAYGYGAGIVLMSAIYTFTHHQYFFGVMHTGMKLRVACCSFIYRKALKLSNKALGQSTIGQMVNLLSNDVNRLDVSCFFIHYLWCGPLQFAIVMYLTYKSVGFAAFVGGGLILLFVPLQSWIGKQFSKLRHETAKRTDVRIRLMSEIIQGIKVIKMYAWEKSFSKLIEEARRAEISVIQKTCFYKAFNMVFFFTSSRMIMALIFLTYVLMGSVLTAEKAFLTLALFNVVRLSMTLFFPNGIQMTSEARISIKRIQEFLLLEEVGDISHQSAIEEVFDSKDGYLQLSQVTGKWSDQSDANTLEDVSFSAKSGELTAIVGPVGSGKGSTLHAILGEMPIERGKIKVNGMISYASQEPWVFSGTIRQNVLFGQPYNGDRYWDVMKVCALTTDIQRFEFGDLTLVGERGVSLSGGQKARINLARAIYRDADIYLLDDPLSAVDAHVGRHLFEECIKTFLQSKVVILVTHQIQFLKEADNILVLRQGKITHQGNFETIMENCEDISSFLHEDKEEEKEEKKTVKEDYAKENFATEHNAQKEVQETSKIGTVSKDVYFGYLKNGANFFTGTILVLATLGTNVCFSMGDLWISKWTNLEDSQLSHLNITQNSTVAIEHIKQSNEYNLMIYALIILGLIVSCATQAVVYFVICMTASRNLHNKMFQNLLATKSRFFDVNPSGRILNRFSKDMGSIDDVLPACILDVKWIFLNIICVFILVSYIQPVIMIPTLFVGTVFFFLRRFFLNTSRSVKRLEGVTKSPIFSQLSSSLNGLTSIRAFKAQNTMIDEFDYHQDIHSSAWFTHLATTRWFGVYLDWIVVLFLTCCVASFILMPSDLMGGDVGVAITSCIVLTGALQYGMRQSAEAETLMTSVERVMEYGQLSPESESESEEVTFPEGVVEFQDVSLRYDEDTKLILKNISFKTESCDKIGIVGRTGAGKSSLITALFRLCELDNGKILIDGINTSKLGLHQLRKKISIIPQDPLLFSTTLRENLDPFNQYCDHEIWSALDQSHLSSTVKELKKGLETEMSEGGSNFSVGQRQLVCLARAILRNNKILVLDEATANVDPKTDAMIQETIRSQFKACTVFTIAHRLHTVMDSDKILVLDDGRVMEFNAPSKLLQDPEGYLTKLVDQTGSSTKKKLLEMAKM